MGLFDSFSSSGGGSSSSSDSSPSATPSTSALASTTTQSSPARAPDTSNKHVTALNPTGIKPCCACPETKGKRDECFLKYGHEEGEEGATRCRSLVEEHRRCMKGLGFNI
ncbi:unnamed protein product [Jaminaea pallidilutea]